MSCSAEGILRGALHGAIRTLTGANPMPTFDLIIDPDFDELDPRELPQIELEG